MMATEFYRPPNPDGELPFHVSEPITVAWHAAPGHSKRDWIGLYRVGANTSYLVTKVNSLGMWVPVHDDQWHGGVGKYEIRYHHDGHLLLSSYPTYLLLVGKPATLDFDSVRDTLLRIVTLCLDSDPLLVSAGIDAAPSEDLCKPTHPTLRSDPDDFRF